MGLSVLYVVRNEEVLLRQSIASVEPIADQIVVVDTGSADGTAGMARGLSRKVKVVPYAWPHDYSKARNYGLQYCDQDWVMYLDADEVIDHKTASLIQDSIQSAKEHVWGFSLKILDFPGGFDSAPMEPFFPSPQVRAFRRKPEVKFEGSAMESVNRSITLAGGSVNLIPGAIKHWIWRGKGMEFAALRVKYYRKLGAILPDPDVAPEPASDRSILNAPPPRPSVAVIIVGYDCVNHTRQCVSGLRKATVPYRLILVDNGSQDDTRAMMNEEAGEDTISLRRNEGLAKARNMALSRIMSDPDIEHVCFLDNDCIPAKGSLEEMIRVLDSDDGLAAVGPISNNSPGAQSFGRDGKPDESAAEIAGREPDRADVSELANFCMVFRADALRRVGLFDENLAGFEAADMCARLRVVGMRMAVANRAFVHHRGRATMTSHSGVDWYSIQQTSAIRFKGKWNIQTEETKARALFLEKARESVPSYIIKPRTKAPTFSSSNLVPTRSILGNPRTDIVIITHNRLDMTRPCIETISRNTKNFQLILVDNASTDGTVEYLSGVPGLRLIRSDKNLGVPKARNIGLRASSAPYVVVMDNDIEVKAGWLEELFKDVNGGAHMVGIEGWKLDKNWGACAKCNSPTEHFDYLGGACTLFDRRVFEVAGILDEGYSPAYYEDSLSGDRFIPIRQNGKISLVSLENIFNMGRIIPRTDGKEESVLTGVETLSVNPERPCLEIDDPSNPPEWWASRYLSDSEREHFEKAKMGIITQNFIDTVRPRIKKRLARYYREDAHASWKPLTKAIRHKAGKEMFRVDSRFGQTCCTGDHSLMVWNGNTLKESTPSEMTLERPCSVSTKVESAVEDHCLLPISGSWNDHAGSASLYTPYDRHDYERYSVPLYQGKPGMSYDDPRSPAWFLFMGYYASEGSSNGSSLSLSVYDKQLAIRIAAAARLSFGRKFEIYEYPAKNAERTIRGRKFLLKKTICYRIAISNKQIAIMMEDFCGKGARNKKVPSFIYNAPDHLKREFLRGLMEGDGHLFNTNSKHSLSYTNEYRSKAFKFSSISLGLASGVCLLLSTMGERFSVGYDEVKKSYAVNYVQFRKNTRKPWAKVHSLGRSDDYVYDLCVEGTHTFVDAMGMLVVHNTEMCIRAKENGFRLAFNPTPAVNHKQHATLVHGQKDFNYNSALGASYDRFSRRMRGELTVKYEKLPTRKLRILYLGMMWDYGDRNRGTSYEQDNFLPSLQQWDKTAELRHFDFVELGKIHGVNRMSDMLVKEAELFQPDAVFSVFFNEDNDPRKDALSSLKRVCPAKTINWFCDSHFRYEDFDSKWAPFLDFCVTTSSAAQHKYIRDGFGGKVIKSQWFASPPYRKIEGVQKDVGVSFVGQPHGDRQDVVAKIRAAGINVEVYGTGWGKRLSFDDMIMMFNRTKVNLNLNNAADARFKQIKGRNFEVPACGGFILTGAPENLPEYYEPGKDLAVFGDLTDMIEKIRYYLKNDSERESLAKSGHERTMREHTFKQRLDAIFASTGLL